MPSTGDIRSDGMVFVGKNKNFKSGEYWMPMDKFLLKHGADYYEKKDRAKRNKQAREESRLRNEKIKVWREANKEELEKERKLKQRIKSAEKYHKTKHLTIEKRKEARKKDYAKMLLDPVRLEKYKAKKERFKTKQREKSKLAREKRKLESEARKKIQAEEAEARRIAREAKQVENEKIRLERLVNKKPPITEEQRKEKKRQEKRNYKHARRARINNCEVRTTPQMVAEARKNAGDRCYYCGKKSELTLDHFEPLAKGGAHCVSNFVFACFSCNSRKRDLDPFDFMASNVAASF
jgi:hypothetical protein